MCKGLNVGWKINRMYVSSKYMHDDDVTGARTGVLTALNCNIHDDRVVAWDLGEKLWFTYGKDVHKIF